MGFKFIDSAEIGNRYIVPVKVDNKTYLLDIDDLSDFELGRGLHKAFFVVKKFRDGFRVVEVTQKSVLESIGESILESDGRKYALASQGHVARQ